MKKIISACTPGPWTLHPRVKQSPPIVYGGGCEICTVHTSCPDPGEQEANALLIAAAPELLARVKQLQMVIGLIVANWERGDLAGAVNDARLAADEADETIDAAEGTNE